MKFKRYSICLFFLFTGNAWAAESGTFSCTTYTGSLSGSNTLSTLSYDITKELIPGTWVDTGMLINIGRTNSDSVIINRYGGTSGCNSLCSMGCVQVSGGGSTSQWASLRTYEQTIDGFSFGIGWNDAPQLQMQYQTHIGDGFVQTINSSTSGTVKWDGEIPSSGYAGQKIYTTSVWNLPRSGLASIIRDRVGAVYFYDAGGTASLYIKVPENLSSGTYTFNNVPLIKLMHYMNNAAFSSIYQNELDAYATITITVPQRCYIATSNTSLDFGNINPSSNTGLLAQKSDTLTTTCYYAPDGTQQTITVSGGASSNYNNNKSMLYYPDLIGSLGVIYAIDKTSLHCNNGDNFDTAYLVNSEKFSSTSIITVENQINFGLCKTGNIASYGQMSLPVKVSVNWTWSK
ncbi:hypothetical protein PO543_19795 [Escherichia coli]